MLLAFEAAERESDPDMRIKLLTFVGVGGGPTGVELAGAVAEIARHTLRGEFRSFDPATARIYLVEGGARVLAAYPPDLSTSAAAALDRLGVTVVTGAVVTDVKPDAVAYRQGEAAIRIETNTVLWAAGVKASPLGRKVAEATGAEVDRSGRVAVGPDLSLPNHPEILVVGDLASFTPPGGRSLPGVAPVAMQQGSYAARLIQSRLRGQSLPPFSYYDRGNMATIGRSSAVADLFGRIRYAGFLAWMTWLFIHLLYLVGFDKRLLVFLQWAWSYFTRKRSARLITGVVGWGAGDWSHGTKAGVSASGVQSADRK